MTTTQETEISGKPARIAPLKDCDIGKEGLDIVAAMRKAVAAPPSNAVSEHVAIMLRHPRLLQRQVDLAVQLYEGALPRRESELAVLRTAWLCQAPYVFGQHVQIAKRAGLSSEDIDHIKVGSAAPEWCAHDRAILRAVEELHETAMISDGTWGVLASKYDEQQLLELPVLVGHFHGVAFVQNSVRLQLKPGSPNLSSR